MTTPDLKALESLTRDYAAFQARKSGLATALGGFLALALFCVAVRPEVFGVQLMQRPALEVMLFVPFIWLALKHLLARLLYRGLGTVKAAPDAGYERRLWFWLLGLALFLMTCLIVAIYGFVSGALMAANPMVGCLPPDHPLFHPWAWLIWMPLLYLAPVPWAIRGIEEARAYAVLVGQCMLWLIPIFLFAFGAFPPVHPLPKVAYVLAPIGILGLVLGITVWSALAMVRGWKEHREYLAILRALPRES
jgi:hypothetical protein